MPRKTLPAASPEPLSLLVPLERADAEIGEQIQKGETILNLPIQSEQDFKSVKSEYQTWSEFNSLRLRQLFSNAQFADEFVVAGSGAVILDSSLRAESRRLHNELEEKLRVLKSIRIRTTTLTVSQPTQPIQDHSISPPSHPQVIGTNDNSQFVDAKRLRELKELHSTKFDLSKLVRLCEELNICYSNECYFAVLALTRSLIDHVPPIFGMLTFPQVASNYSTRGIRSLKPSFQRLNTISRDIADLHLHRPIQQKVALPNQTQVEFRNELDLLLAEILTIIVSRT